MLLITLTQPVTFETIITDLKKHNVITAKFAEKLMDSKNINELDSGTSILHFALFKGASLSVIKELIRFGADVSLTTHQSCTPLMLAAFSGNEEAVAYFLSIMNDVSQTNVNGGNVLHMSARVNQFSIIKILLKDPRIQAIKDVQDIQGRTPLTIAIQYAHDQCISELTGEQAENYKSHPSYGIPPKSFDQNQYNTKLQSYLKSSGVDDEFAYIEKNGTCNALSFMYPLYKHGLKNPAYIESLHFIKNWDINKKSLDATEIPQALKGQFSRKGVDKPEYIIEHLVNDTVLYQAHANAYRELKLKGGQDSREAQYELSRGDSSPHVKKVASYTTVNSFTGEQLSEMIQFLSGYRECLIMLGGAQHTTSLYITKTGEYDYYDCNFEVDAALLFTDAKHLAEHIIKSKYKQLGKPDQNVWIDFRVYTFSDNDESSLENHYTETEVPAVSPNKFNACHYAVMSNNLDKIKLFIENTSAANDKWEEKDAHGLTPVERALDLGFSGIASYILGKIELTEDHLSSLINIAIKRRDTMCFEQLIRLSKMTVKNLCREIVTNTHDAVTDNYNDSDTIALLDVVSKVHGKIDFSRMPSLLNHAIALGQEKIVEYMLANNANPLIGTKNQGTGLFTAVNNYYDNNSIIVDMLIENIKDVHAKDNDGMTLIDYATKYNKTSLADHLNSYKPHKLPQNKI